MAKEKKGGGVREGIKTIVYAALIAVGIRTLAYEPFNIPSESMVPTLLVGDYLFVSKFSYGYSRHSLPFSLPIIPGRIFSGIPKRGDVAVFKWPGDNSTDYIKRIIGLPGDRIQLRNGVLHVNDRPVDRTRMEDFIHHDAFGGRRAYPQFIETLPNGKSYRVVDMTLNSEGDNTRVFVVPAGHYFALGDNRDNSSDSRVPTEARGVGFIPEVNMVGRAEFIFFSTDGSARLWEFWKWIQAARFSRFFNGID